VHDAPQPRRVYYLREKEGLHMLRCLLNPLAIVKLLYISHFGMQATRQVNAKLEPCQLQNDL
jgi:hypothetical protein